MPVVIPEKLPAYDILRGDHIFVMSEQRAIAQDIRPLKICILNLMPDKITTETQILRKLSNSMLQVEITLLTTSTYRSKHTEKSHLTAFYKTFGDIREDYFDGMIVTGAPIEHLAFEDVDYWMELTEILDWTLTNVFNTLFICWGAQAALYHFYGIDKMAFPKKLFGVYPHTWEREDELALGMNPVFYVPQSRHTQSREELLRSNPNIDVVASSKETGIHLSVSKDRRQVFMTGHPEYDKNALNREYLRDVDEDDVTLPVGYFVDDDPKKGIALTWKSDGSIFYQNWLNYYVYQVTDYSWTEE